MKNPLLCAAPALPMISFPILIIMAALLFPPSARAQQEAPNPFYTMMLRPGALLIGFGGSLTVVEEVAHATATLRSGPFFDVPGGLGCIEGELSYSHINGLDQLDAEARFTWSRQLGQSMAYPFIGIGGGVRNEWIGSFSQQRYPAGAEAGIRGVVDWQAFIEMAYRFRRIFGDPVADYNEHRIVVGVGLLIGNRR